MYDLSPGLKTKGIASNVPLGAATHPPTRELGAREAVPKGVNEAIPFAKGQSRRLERLDIDLLAATPWGVTSGGYEEPEWGSNDASVGL